MKKLQWIALSAFTLLFASGCVAQANMDQLDMAYRKSQEQVTELRARLEESQATINALRQARSTSADPNLEQRLASALADKQRLETRLGDLEKRIRSMGGESGPLPVELSNELAALARQFPDLLSFDQQRGMVKLSSDLTFALGSTEVKTSAQAALQKFASILKSPVASRYEAMIVGHTDNVPISRADTKAKHPTNWYLSVHRAIAVKDVLETSGVGPGNMSVAGYGEYRPIVPNAPSNRGAEMNRRVEIFLVASTSNGIDPNAASSRPIANVDTTDKAGAGSAVRSNKIDSPELYK